MKISLIGYGKMGKMIEEEAVLRGHEIVDRIDPALEEKHLSDADVYIDFTHPDTVLSNITTVASWGKNIVVGTTGWHDKIDDITKIVKKNDIGLVYAPNFSLGVNLFMKMISFAANLMKHYPEYDIAGFEAHHNKKVDAPSGTAKELASLFDKEIDFSSLRCGNIPGTHSIILDSEADTITLTHQARNRKGFALGAVLAAEWVVDKKGMHKFSV
jgi:4-hydroxy-tetrahydrodipicolinate reductase